MQNSCARLILCACRLAVQKFAIGLLLPKLRAIPVAIVTAEASYHAVYDHCTAKYLTQAGVTNTFIRLEHEGIHGNGHMMMLELGSDAIAGVVQRWLASHVK